MHTWHSNYFQQKLLNYDLKTLDSDLNIGAATHKNSDVDVKLRGQSGNQKRRRNLIQRRRGEKVERHQRRALQKGANAELSVCGVVGNDYERRPEVATDAADDATQQEEDRGQRGRRRRKRAKQRRR